MEGPIQVMGCRACGPPAVLTSNALAVLLPVGHAAPAAAHEHARNGLRGHLRTAASADGSKEGLSC